MKAILAFVEEKIRVLLADLDKSKINVIIAHGIHEIFYSFSLDVAEWLECVEDKTYVVARLPIHIA